MSFDKIVRISTEIEDGNRAGFLKLKIVDSKEVFTYILIIYSMLIDAINLTLFDR